MKKAIKKKTIQKAIKQAVMPSKTLAQGFTYTSAIHTDVRQTWMRFGWKPVHNI